MAELLIELFSEEIPARMQAKATDELRRLVTDGLVEAGLTYAHAAAFATPRRLALVVDGLTDHSPTVREERRGPKVGAPEKAIEGFLRSTGLEMSDLSVQDDKKGQVYIARIETSGREAPAIVAEVLERVIRNFPWPKSMRWGSGSLRWVRPLHRIVCILSREDGAQVVPLSVDGIAAGDVTSGHRFMAAEAFSVANFADYETKLKRAFVILDPAARADHIRAEAQSAAFAQGLELVEDAGLLAEVAGLVEWPVVLLGRIEEQFLDLPPEVLQTSMKEHQKFFSLRDPKRRQITGFVTVANRDTADHGATILAGNQKVLAARLSDAKFFWDNDLRRISDVRLEGMAAGLAHVTFHNKLGTQADRIARIEALAREIAPLVGADADEAALAARVVKADLQSEMVGEFPEVQGVMGGYYARKQGLSEAVAAACSEHYQPLGPSDSVPANPISVAVALADKIDMLTGFWAIDEKPTGSKDPFALRRAALGVIRLVLGNGVRFGIRTPLINMVVRAFGFSRGLESGDVARKIVSELEKIGETALADAFEPQICSGLELNAKSADDVELLQKQLAKADDLLTFFHDRLKVHLRDQGIRHDVIDACLSVSSGVPVGATPNNDDLTLLVKRAEALSAFLKTDDGENLLQGFKRANNILSQAEAKDGVEYSFGPDPKLAETPEETALFDALDRAEAAIAPAMEAEDFAAAMGAMAALRAPIDGFFDSVQVNSDNQIIRRNRLNLLHRIRATCLQVADLTRLDG